jgi:hypothetical protein
MSRYSDEEKAESIRRARELLEQLDARPPYEPAGEDALQAAHRLDFPPLEDPVAKWRREALEIEAKCDRERVQTAAELNAERTAQWEAWADARIAAALAEHDRILVKTLGGVVAEERKRQRDELAKLAARIEALETKQRGVDDGAVVELPSLLIRKVRGDAA